jgi:hypothetical protein
MTTPLLSFKHHYYALAMVINCVIVVSVGASTGVWDIALPRVAFTNESMKSVLHYVENESQKLDPAGRGVRILFNENWLGAGLASVDWRGKSLRWIVEKGVGRQCVIVDDVALIFDHANVPVHRMAVVFGTCHDADSGTPLRNMKIRTEWDNGLKSCNTMVDDKGNFIGYVTYGFVRPWLEGVGHLHNSTYETINIVAEAPGYCNERYDVFVGDHNTGVYQQSLDVRLHREKGVRAVILNSMASVSGRLGWKLNFACGAAILLFVILLWRFK